MTTNANSLAQRIRPLILLVLAGLVVLGLCFFGSLVGMQFGHHYSDHNDYIAFYIAAFMAVHGHSAGLYDAQAMAAAQHQYLPAGAGGSLGYMPYLNPPFMAVMLAPLALGTLMVTRDAWFLFNLLLTIGTAWWFTQGVRSVWVRLLGGALITTSLPFYQALLEGQVSIIILVGSLLALWFSEKNKPFTAGLCLVVLMVKPQLALVLGAGFLLFRQWRLLAGMVVSVLGAIVVTVPVTGLVSYSRYVQYMVSVTAGHFTGAGAAGPTAWQGALDQMIGVNGLYNAYVGQGSTRVVNILTVSTIAVLLGLYGLAIRHKRPSLRGESGRVLLACSLMLVLLLDPHMFIQDAVLLLVPLAVLSPILPKFSIITLYVLLAQLLIIDQRFVPVHIVTLLLLGFVVIVSLLALFSGYRGRVRQLIDLLHNGIYLFDRIVDANSHVLVQRRSTDLEHGALGERAGLS